MVDILKPTLVEKPCGQRANFDRATQLSQFILSCQHLCDYQSIMTLSSTILDEIVESFTKMQTQRVG